MKLTQLHLNYWDARRGPRFEREFFKAIKKGIFHHEVNVDDLIPKIEKENLVAHNLLISVRSARRRNIPLKETLTTIMKFGSHKTARAYAKKWLKRMG